MTPELAERMKRPADVPCNGCTACCRKDRIVLERGDDLDALYWHAEGNRAVLDRHGDDSCVYCGPAGCEAHDKRPAICRRFDCRVLVLITPADKQARRVRENPTMAAVYAAGRERLHTLDP